MTPEIDGVERTSEGTGVVSEGIDAKPDGTETELVVGEAVDADGNLIPTPPDPSDEPADDTVDPEPAVDAELLVDEEGFAEVVVIVDSFAYMTDADVRRYASKGDALILHADTARRGIRRGLLAPA